MLVGDRRGLQLQRLAQPIMRVGPDPAGMTPLIRGSGFALGPIALVGVGQAVHASSGRVDQLDRLAAVAEAPVPTADNCGLRRDGVRIVKRRHVGRHDEILVRVDRDVRESKRDAVGKLPVEQIDRVDPPVVQLDVFLPRDPRIGIVRLLDRVVHDLADHDHLGRVIHGEADVGLAGRRLQEIALRAEVGGQSERDVFELRGKRGRREREFHRDRRAVVVEQRQIVAALAQREIGVQHAGRIAAIVPRGEHHEVLTRIERHGREGPRLGVAEGVGEVVAGQIDRRGRGIVDLDPVLVLTVFIGQPVFIVGHEFGDHQRVAVEDQPRFERFEHPPTVPAGPPAGAGPPAPSQRVARRDQGVLEVAKHDHLH